MSLRDKKNVDSGVIYEKQDLRETEVSKWARNTMIYMHGFVWQLNLNCFVRNGTCTFPHFFKIGIK